MNKYTEIIEKYLNGELSAEDKTAFEKLLETNSELRTELELQKQVLKGIDRAAIKAELKKGFKKGSFKAKSGKWFTGIVIAALAVSTVFVVKNKLFSSEKENVRYELNEENNKQWNEADKKLEAQVFNINTNNDTVIETRGGIVLTIPANAFLNNNTTATGNVELEIKEALTPFEIMKAGLSTTSNGQLLETGGMFYVNARQSGNNLSIAKEKSIYTSIPNTNPGKKMMLFDGKRMADGQINWVNPKQFEKKLNTVDILSLNFYPPNFLDSLKQMGYNIKNKKLTDSIYYSFVCGELSAIYYHSSEANEFDNNEKAADSLANAITIAMNSNSSKVVAIKSNNEYGYYHVSDSYCEIAPSRIHAIWDKKFNNTLLATKEFEERLQAIFKTCNHEILGLYVNNLNKKMYEIDSIASKMLHKDTREILPTFTEFYNRRDGGISVNESHIKKLKDYMEEKQKIYEEAAKNAIKKMYEKENKEDKEAWAKRSSESIKEVTRSNKVFREELETNMKEAYRQLGKEYRPYVGGNNYLSGTIVTTGWKNVDAYVYESTTNRTTLNYTDRETGKKAIIRYEPFGINVTGKENYDRLVAYLIPDKLSSFQRMKDTIAGFKENLNELFSYSAVVFAFKGDDVFYQTVKTVKPGTVTVSLSKMSRSELEHYRNMNVAATRDLVSELNYQLFEQKDAIRKKAIAKREDLRKRLWPVVFPCNLYQHHQLLDVIRH